MGCRFGFTSHLFGLFSVGPVASFSAVASVGVNPADQRWGFWPLLPLSYDSWQEA